MSEAIKRIDLLRNLYNNNARSADATISELQEIKSELKIANDENARESDKTTTVTHSPYLTDQPYYNKEVVYNSLQETDWKQVRSNEENLRAALIFKTMRKLNII